MLNKYLIGQWSVYGWINENLNKNDNYQWMWQRMCSECITNIYWDIKCLRTRNWMYNEYVETVKLVPIAIFAFE